MSNCEVVNEGREDENIDLTYLLSLLLLKKWIILFCTTLFSIVSLSIALYLPNKYVAESTLMPTSQSGQGKFSALAGQYAGLASLAGIDLGNLGSANKPAFIIETLKSRLFIQYFFNKHELVVPLFAGVGEVEHSGEWIIDQDIYNAVGKKWLRKESYPFKAEPDYWEIYKEFTDEVYSIVEDKKSGMIRVRIKLKSANAAKQWNDWLIADLNEWMRDKDRKEKEKNIQYLLEQVQKTDVAEMQKLLFSLIEREQSDLMLASVQTEYAVKVLDPAVVPKMKSEPKRALIISIGTCLGLLLSIIGVLFFSSLNERHVAE